MKFIALIVFIALSYGLFILLDRYFSPTSQDAVLEQTSEQSNASKFVSYPEISFADDDIYQPAKTHTIKTGESINGIAILYQTSAELIAQANNITNQDHIPAESTLVIPQYDALTMSNVVYFASGQRSSASITIEQELNGYLSKNSLSAEQITVSDQEQDKAKAQVTINGLVRNFYLYHYQNKDWQIYALEVK